MFVIENQDRSTRELVSNIFDRLVRPQHHFRPNESFDPFSRFFRIFALPVVPYPPFVFSRPFSFLLIAFILR